MQRMSLRTRLFQNAVKLSKVRLLRSGKFTVNCIVFVALVSIGIFGPFFTPYEKTRPGTYPLYLPPSSTHILGTDGYGRDCWATLVYGIQQSFMIGLYAGLTGTFLGLLFGLIAGYKGGIVDHILRGITDTMLVIPSFLLLVVIACVIPRVTLEIMAMVIAIFAWPGPARIIRSYTMSFMKKQYLSLAKLSGLSSVEIIFSEIMPNMLPYIGVVFANSLSGAILTETGLQVIGLAPPGLTTLGHILQYAIAQGALMRGIWWWIIPPIACLIIIFTTLNLMNIALDEIYNPRLRKR